MKTKQATKELLEAHYKDLVEKPFFPKLRDYMLRYVQQHTRWSTCQTSIAKTVTQISLVPHSFQMHNASLLFVKKSENGYTCAVAQWYAWCGKERKPSPLEEKCWVLPIHWKVLLERFEETFALK
jgi:hypothetical protein